MKWIFSHSNKRDDAVYKFKSAAISLIGNQVTEEHFPRIATKVPGWGISFVKILESQQCKVPPWLQGPKIEPRVPDSRGWDPRSWIGVTPLFFVPSLSFHRCWCVVQRAAHEYGAGLAGKKQEKNCGYQHTLDEEYLHLRPSSSCKLIWLMQVVHHQRLS
jgi:hypothetical protein